MFWLHFVGAKEVPVCLKKEGENESRTDSYLSFQSHRFFFSTLALIRRRPVTHHQCFSFSRPLKDFEISVWIFRKLEDKIHGGFNGENKKPLLFLWPRPPVMSRRRGVGSDCACSRVGT